MIKAISLVSIPVRDQNQALEFYTKKLGFQILTDQPFGLQRWIELLIPGADTRIALFTPPGQESRIGTFSNIAFLTDSVEKTYEELRGRGVEFEAPPKKEPWGTSAVFRDPEGNSFAMSSK
jgi:catechol 2,3-dioxygenase-like lactoylglutathione lyase family enzyme